MQSDKKNPTIDFKDDPNKQYFFGKTVLDDCFFDLYQHLAILHKEKTKQLAIPSEEHHGGRLFVLNIWDVGINHGVLHFLSLLIGHLHHSYPIPCLGIQDDLDYLKTKVEVDEPVVEQFIRINFLLQFAHLARKVKRYDQGRMSMKDDRKGVCQIVGIIEDIKPSIERKKLSENLHHMIMPVAKNLKWKNLLMKKSLVY